MAWPISILCILSRIVQTERVDVVRSSIQESLSTRLSSTNHRFRPFLALLVVLLSLSGEQQAIVDGAELDVRRSFTQGGDITIAAILPMFSPAPGEGKVCENTEESFSHRLTFRFVEPFLFMLKRRNFKLEAVVRQGSTIDRRSLRLGYIVFDQCRGGIGGQMESVSLALRLSSENELCAGNEAGDAASLKSMTKHDRVLAVVGPADEYDKIAMAASFTSAYKLVQIAPGSLRDEISCGIPDRECFSDYPYFFRASGNDRFQAFAIRDLLLRFGWTHFAVVAGKDVSNTAMLAAFLQSIIGTDLCPAFTATLNTVEDAKGIERSLRDHRRAKVLVVFAEKKQVQLLADIILQNPNNESKNDLPLVWIGNDRWDAAKDLVFSPMGEEYRRTMQAVIGIEEREMTAMDGWEWPLMSDSYIKQYANFIRSITAGMIRKERSLTSNPLLCLVMEKANRCSGVCSDNRTVPTEQRCPDIITLVQSDDGEGLEAEADQSTMQATEVLLRAMESLFAEFVQDFPDLAGGQLAARFYEYAYGDRLKDAMRGVTLSCLNATDDCDVFPGGHHEFAPEFQIVAAGENGTQWIGSWKAEKADGAVPVNVSLDIDESLVNFGTKLFESASMLNSPNIPRSSQLIPMSSCPQSCSAGQQKSAKSHTCCFECDSCPVGQYSPGGLEQCRMCAEGFMPDSSQSSCLQMPRMFMDTPVMLALCIAGAVAATILLTTLCVVVYHRKTAIIRCSDYPLTIALLIILMFGYSGISFHVKQPTSSVCTACRLFDTLSLLASSIIVLVKTSRLARIHFMSAAFKKASARWTMTIPAQLLFAAMLVTVGFSMEVVALFFSGSVATWTYSHNRAYRVCMSPEWLILAVDTYLLILIFVTVLLAFPTRKMAINYNEAQLLFLTSFSQCLLWGVLRTTYYMADPQNRYLPEVILVMAHLASIWVWLMLPRVYVLLFTPHSENDSLPKIAVAAGNQIDSSTGVWRNSTHTQASSTDTLRSDDAGVNTLKKISYAGSHQFC